MAISSGCVLKRPKVVEESHTSDSDDSQSESESESEEEQELESGDVEIKEEVEDDYLDNSNITGESFTAYSNDEDFDEIKKEEEEEGNEAGSSTNEDKEVVYSKKKRTKKVKSTKAESDSNDSGDVGESESEEDEDNIDEDESVKEEEGEEDSENTGSGLANVMAKILGTKKSEDVILSKAKTDREVKKSMKVKKEDTFEIVDSSGQVRTEPMVEKIKEEEEEEKPIISLHDRELHRKLWEEKFRKRPSITEDWEKERKLRVLATQGVVQLFSAIEKHRTMMQVKLSQCRSNMGREKILESTGKEAFLDILKQQGKRMKKMDPEDSNVKEENDHLKEEVKDEPVDLQPPVKKKPKWNVFSDNFYKEPTLHGWDQESDDEDD